ncbi:MULTISPECIES: hypothetical protein [Streptomyces violaceusniger group]|uniref:Uncharacterized protein n=2 Tax=Streptomyces javensis TaxID=114698 RepID=A0ABS0RES0_9ACTN|nr:hypothetical protein [Streptomyces javensis]MBI0315823.1 hypothetical protein [Streptomyces javensis]
MAVMRSVEQVVGVERRQFALCDGDAPFADRPWRLPDAVEDGVVVNDSEVVVSSAIAMRDADVRLKLWDGRAETRDPMVLVGEVVWESRSGAVMAWAVPQWAG